MAQIGGEERTSQLGPALVVSAVAAAAAAAVAGVELLGAAQPQLRRCQSQLQSL